MIFYLLDSSFKRTDVIDNYESAIWTERYLEPGDFEFYIPINRSIPSSLAVGKYLISKDSDYTMVIESMKIETDVEDTNKLIVTGRSLESILDRRIVWKKTVFEKDTNLQTAIRQLINDNIINPKNEDGTSFTKRQIPNFVFKSSTDSAITSLKLTDGAEYYGEDILDVVTKLCDDNKIGFKVILDHETKKFTFSLYAGKDRTKRDASRDYVEFSSKIENLLNTDYSCDTKSYKNVVYCVGPAEDVYNKVDPVGNENPKEEGWYKWDPTQNEYISTEDTYVKSEQWDPIQHKMVPLIYYEKDDIEKRKMKAVVGNASGLKRREVFNDCRSASRTGDVTYDPATIDEHRNNPKEEGWYKQHIDPDGILEYIKAQEEEPEKDSHGHTIQYYWKNTHTRDDAMFTDLLKQMGKEKLTEKKREEKFESEVDIYGTFKYGKHYKIGDIVQIINEYGFTGRARVTEYIFSDNTNGLKCYPKFEMIDEDEEG